MSANNHDFSLATNEISIFYKWQWWADVRLATKDFIKTFLILEKSLLPTKEQCSIDFISFSRITLFSYSYTEVI